MLVALERAMDRAYIRVRPRIGIASELGRKELAEQATVLGTESGVVDETPPLSMKSVVILAIFGRLSSMT